MVILIYVLQVEQESLSFTMTNNIIEMFPINIIGHKDVSILNDVRCL